MPGQPSTGVRVDTKATFGLRPVSCLRDVIKTSGTAPKHIQHRLQSAPKHIQHRLQFLKGELVSEVSREHRRLSMRASQMGLGHLAGKLDTAVLRHTLHTQRQIQMQHMLDRNPIRNACQKLIDEPGHSKASAAVFGIVMLTIFTSVINWHIATTLRVRNDPSARSISEGIETGCTVIFVAELCVRLFVSTINP